VRPFVFTYIRWSATSSHALVAQAAQAGAVEKRETPSAADFSNDMKIPKAIKICSSRATDLQAVP
jgi:hypothetical protein